MPYLDTEKQKAAKHASYLRNKEKVFNNNRIARLKLRDWFKLIMNQYSCIACGEDARECLDLHHIDPTLKHDDVSKLLAEKRSKSRIVAEIEKCTVLCSNCHRKHHAGTLHLEITNYHLVTVPERFR